jgi:hypothetical protein
MVAVAAALAVGVVCGGLARVLMRLVAVAADEETSFTLAGTAAIMVVFAAFALPGTLLAALAVRPRGRRVLHRVRGRVRRRCGDRDLPVLPGDPGRRAGHDLDVEPVVR